MLSACSALNGIHGVKAHELQPIKTVLVQPLSPTTPLLTPLSGRLLILQAFSCMDILTQGRLCNFFNTYNKMLLLKMCKEKSIFTLPKYMTISPGFTDEV